MTLPLASRRSTASWAVNTVTLVALVSSVWLSAQQRPAYQPGVGTGPGLATDKQPSSDSSTVAAVSHATANAAPVGIDGVSIRPVAYRATVSR